MSTPRSGVACSRRAARLIDVPDGGELHALLGADISHDGQACIDADAYAQGSQSVARPAFGAWPIFPAVPSQGVAHIERGLHGVFLLKFVVAQGAKERHEAVAHEFVQVPEVLENRVDHLLEVVVQHRDCFLRAQLLGKIGESTHVGEERGDFLSLAVKFGRSAGVDDFIEDVLGYIARERAFEILSLLQTNGHLVESFGHFTKLVFRGSLSVWL